MIYKKTLIFSTNIPSKSLPMWCCINNGKLKIEIRQFRIKPSETALSTNSFQEFKLLLTPSYNYLVKREDIVRNDFGEVLKLNPCCSFLNMTAANVNKNSGATFPEIQNPLVQLEVEPTVSQIW